MPVGEDRGQPGGGERTVIGQHAREQHPQRVDDEKRQQRPQRERGARDGGVRVQAARL